MNPYRGTAPGSCTFCASTRVSAPTLLDPTDGFLKIRYEESVDFVVGRARVCLDCGHVMVFLSETQLERLRGMAPRLRPRDS